MENKKSIAICCIIKQENLYLRDFVEYHKKQGIDNIILYDNNDIEGEYPQQVIGDYIQNGFVIYKNCRGKHRYQIQAYDECYAEFRNVYEWLGFIDADEFLTTADGEMFSDFISKPVFGRFDAVYCHWLNYGDNGLLHYENKPVFERFTVPSFKKTETVNYKVFLHASDNLDIQFLDANAFRFRKRARGNFTVCNGVGEDFEGNNPWTSPEYRGIFIRHYNTLTIEEFLYRRFGRRGYADNASSFNKDRVMRIFYDLNTVTPEKEAIINDFFSKFEFKEDNV